MPDNGDVHHDRDEDDEDEDAPDDGADDEDKSSAAGMFVRLAVTLSLHVVRALLHTPTDRVLTAVADLAIGEAIRGRAQDAARRKLDLASIADELVRASGRALRDTGLSRPEFEMTGEAFSTVLRLATQFSDPTKDISADELYDAAHAYAALFAFGRASSDEEARAPTAPLAARMRRSEPPPPVRAMRRYVRSAMAVYGTLAMKFLGILSRVDTTVWSNTQAIQYLTGIDTEENLVAAKWRANWVGSIYRPGYFVLLDHANKEIILAVRGSYRFQDALTDLMCEDADFTFHFVEEESLESAQRELQEVAGALEGALAGLDDTDDAERRASVRSAAASQAVAATLPPPSSPGARDTAGEVFRKLKRWVSKQTVLVAQELKEVKRRQSEHHPPSDKDVNDNDNDDESDDDDDGDGGGVAHEPLAPAASSSTSSLRSLTASLQRFGSLRSRGASKASKPKRRQPTTYATRRKSKAQALSEEYPGPDESPDGHTQLRGRAHFGFLKAAQALAAELEDVVAETVRAHPGYQLVLVGHSLGAAVATIMTLLWSHHPDLRGARCYGVAAPSCVSQDIAESPVARARITSVVLGDDVVPRLSLGSVSDLRNSIVYCASTLAPGETRTEANGGRTVAKWIKDTVAAARAEQQAAEARGDAAAAQAVAVALRRALSPVLEDIRSQEHVHEKLLPAGVVWHVPSLEQGFAAARRRPGADFGELVLAPGMFDAHLPQRYAYACCDKLPLSEADAEAEREIERQESAKRGSLRASLPRVLSRRKS